MLKARPWAESIMLSAKQWNHPFHQSRSFCRGLDIKKRLSPAFSRLRRDERAGTGAARQADGNGDERILECEACVNAEGTQTSDQNFFIHIQSHLTLQHTFAISLSRHLSSHFLYPLFNSPILYYHLVPPSSLQDTTPGASCSPPVPPTSWPL